MLYALHLVLQEKGLHMIFSVTNESLIIQSRNSISDKISWAAFL